MQLGSTYSNPLYFDELTVHYLIFHKKTSLFELSLVLIAYRGCTYYQEQEFAFASSWED
jgi:hypothetical protein